VPAIYGADRSFPPPGDYWKRWLPDPEHAVAVAAALSITLSRL
jgi:hypothetical protein